MKRGALVATTLALCLVAGGSWAERPALRSVAHRLPALRSVAHHLIDALVDAELIPSELGALPPGCFSLDRRRPSPNPFTPLPEPLAARHVRMTTRTAPHHEVELRDAIVLEAPRRIRYRLTLPPGAALELGYRALPCGAWYNTAKLSVRLERVGAEPWMRSFPIAEPRRDRAAKQWHPLKLALPDTRPGEEVVLELRLEAGKSRPIALANPVITGLPEAAPSGGGDLNVLLIVVDAMRPDVVGPGRRFDRPLVPSLERLMGLGTSFTAAYSMANQTRSSTLAFLSSQPPSLGGFHHRGWKIPRPKKDAFYARSPPLLTRLLRAGGWRTRHIGHNRFMWDGISVGLDHGFDHHEDARQKVKDTPKITKLALRFLRERRDDRWFLMLNYVTPHLPYNPPRSYIAEAKRRFGDIGPNAISVHYLAEYLYLEDHIRPVVEALERDGLLERTLVIVTADHGETFHPDHHCWSNMFRQRCDHNHGLTMYDEEVRVPLAFVLPQRISKGQVVATPTSHRHLAPTVLDLVGLPPTVEHTGRSLAPELSGSPAPWEAIYVEGRQVAALRSGDLKLIVHNKRDDTWTPARTGPGPDKFRSDLELYDLAADPQETRNLALEGDLRVAKMQAELAKTREAIASASLDEPAASGHVAAAAPGELASRAENVLLLQPGPGEHVLRGHVRAPRGTIECGATAGGAVCIRLSPTELLVALQASERAASVTFDTTPWRGPVELDLLLDDAALAAHAVRLGAYGLALLGKGATLDTPEALGLAAAHQAPLLPRRSPHAQVFMWRSARPEGDVAGGVAAQPEAPRTPAMLGPEDVEAPAEDELDAELHTLLKGLGYTK